MRRVVRRALCAFLLVAGSAGVLAEQSPPPRRPATPAPWLAPLPPTEKLGDNLFRIGDIRVDTASREISVAGEVNPHVVQLEYIANTQSGVRAYESVVTLNTSGIGFNAALMLIGLDPSHARNVPKRHFDPAVPEGDEVEVWIDCPKAECQRIPAERLLYDKGKQAPVTGGTWVYTGSSFIPRGPYRPEVDGTLIGFVHDPSAIIEYTGSGGLSRFGYIVTNPALGLKDGTAIVLTVKAVTASAR